MLPSARRSGRRLHLCALTACAALWGQPAFAALASFDFPVRAAFTTNGAQLQESLIELPNSAEPAFTIGFMLPRDYKNDTPVKIVLYMSANSACEVRLQTATLIRKRPGSTPGNNLSGLTGDGQAVMPALGAIAVKPFTLIAGGALPGQRRGDGIDIKFARISGHAMDTCGGSAFVRAIEIRYEKLP